jgi:hypothetical protein
MRAGQDAMKQFDDALASPAGVGGKEANSRAPAVPQDQQSIEQAKRDCRHDEHIHRSDPISVIAE